MRSNDSSPDSVPHQATGQNDQAPAECADADPADRAGLETTNQALLQRRNAAVPRGPFNIAPIFVDRAQGSLLWDVEGREYIDFCGGIGVANVGHNHPKVVAAIKAQADRFLHTCFHVVMYEPYVRLAERLNALVPIPGPCCTALFNSGAEANENAVKISRAATGRPAVLAFERAFHGRTLLGMTLTGKCHPYTAGFGPFAPEVYRLPLHPFFRRPGLESDETIAHLTREALEHLAAYHIEPERIACVLMEPVLGEGGFLPAHPVAIALLRTWCRDHGILFVSDEVQSGFGRCGALFACERYGLEPDMIVMAKSLAGGLVLSAVTGRETLLQAPAVGGIGGTFGGNPLACAAANAVIDVLLEEDLPRRAEVIGDKVLTRFEEFRSRYAFIGDVRGLGAMCGLELVDPASGRPDPARANRVCQEALERGLLLMTASSNVIRTLMPLTIPDETLERALNILEECLEQVAHG